VTVPGARSGFELVVLGAGPAYTDRPGAVGAAYLIRHGTDALLLDLGQGAFTNLAAFIEPSTLTAVAISHLHPDHFVDLVSLRHYLRYEFHPPRRVAVIAPAGLTDRLDALHAQPGFTAASLDVADLRPGVRPVGGFTLETVRVQHTDDSHAFRVSIGSGPGLVYSGDCGAADDLRPLIRPGDTLLAEATYGADPVEPGSNHLNAVDVARLAAATGAARVLLTHVLIHRDRSRAVAAAADLVSVPVAVVDPGDRFEL
jgi:ribonuclease BN (tRNA processing enzyme)